MSKKYFVIIFLLSLPFMTSAAFDTVQFTETTDIYLGNGLTLQVLSGSKVAEMTVGSNSVTFNKESGSTVTVRSYDKKYLTNNLGLHTSCLEDYSQVDLTSGVTQTFVITPEPEGICQEEITEDDAGGYSSRSGQMLPHIIPEKGDVGDEQTITERKIEEGTPAEGMAPGEALPGEKAALPGVEEAPEPGELETKEDMSEKKVELDSTLIFGIIAAVVLAGIAAYYFLKKKA